MHLVVGLSTYCVVLESPNTTTYTKTAEIVDDQQEDVYNYNRTYINYFKFFRNNILFNLKCSKKRRFGFITFIASPTN